MQQRLNPGTDSNSPKEFICWKTRESEAAIASAQFTVGSLIDVLDTCNSWLPARVEKVNVEEASIFIHYTSYSNKWDEWVPMDSYRVAPYQSQTGESLHVVYVVSLSVSASTSERFCDNLRFAHLCICMLEWICICKTVLAYA